MNEEKTYKIEFDCPLMLEDKIRFGEIQAESTTRLEEIEDELKDLKAEKVRAEKTRSKAARIIKQGFQTRPIECRAEFNVPETGKVSYFSLDESLLIPMDKPIKIEVMTQEQMEL